MKDKLTVTAVITNKCNLKCTMCPAGCPREAPEIDFRSMLDWLGTYAPGCDLHISGGEPLLIEGLHRKLQMCVDAGHDVTVFTNGSLIRRNLELINLPVKWHVTHHASQVEIEAFLFNVIPLRTKPHVICRLRAANDVGHKASGIEKLYEGHNFKWIVPYCGYFGYVGKSADSPICDSIIMIGVDGAVYPCSTVRAGDLGNIYDMTFDRERANAFKCLSNKCVSKCQAYQSARIMDRITI